MFVRNMIPKAVEPWSRDHDLALSNVIFCCGPTVNDGKFCGILILPLAPFKSFFEAIYSIIQNLDEGRQLLP